MIIANFFQQHESLRTQMRKEFKEKGYDLKEKRWVLNEVLSYAPNLKDMTISEQEQVLDYLRTKEAKQNGNKQCSTLLAND